MAGAPLECEGRWIGRRPTQALELERCGHAVAYVRTRDGAEVDFLARAVGERPLLLQVCADARGSATLARELRALVSARAEHRDAQLVLITLDSSPPPRDVPKEVSWIPAARWLLEADNARELP